MMKAARLHAAGQPLKIEDIPVPRVTTNNVLVRVQAAGICGTDLHIQDGEFSKVPGVENPGMQLPRVLGHEISGTVEMAKHDGRLKVGDRVLIDPIVSCGQCYNCLRGLAPALCERKIVYGETTDGGFEEFVSVCIQNAHKIPPEISFEEAAILCDALATPYHAIDYLGVTIGDTVAIYGIGGLGMNAVQLARIRGATVLAVDVHDEKLEIAKEMGADVLINSRKTDPVQRIREATHGRGANKVLEVVGSQATVEQAIRSVSMGGKIGVLGGSNEDFRVGIRQLLWNDISIVACLGRLKPYLPTMLDLVARKQINLEKMVTDRIRLEDANEGFRILREKIGSPIRVVILPKA